MIIIQLQGAIFERIRNIQIQVLQTVLFKHYRRRVVYNDITRDYITCYLTLYHVAEHRYVKCPVHFFRWNMFIHCGMNKMFKPIELQEN